MQKITPQSKSQGKFTLFNKTVDVLYISGNKLQLSSVIVSNTPKISKQYETTFTDSNLKESIVNLISKLNTKSLYLLLGKDFAYVVRFSIPMHIQGSEERTYVFRNISEIVPEILSDNDWDYKETALGKEEKEVLAFAVVKEKFNKLDEIFKSLSIKIDAIEPEEISLMRNENPVIGISLKDDIQGSDNKTLNIKLNKKSPNLSPAIMLGWVVVGSSALVLTLLLDMVFRGWLY